MSQICACGCSQEFERVPGKGIPLRFIPGHQFRSEAARQAQRVSLMRWTQATTLDDRRRLTPPPDVLNSDGFCRCGCGERTQIATKTQKSRGWYAGYPIAYTHGHNRRGFKGPDNPIFKGRIQGQNGYMLIYAPDHPAAYTRPKGRVGYVLEHRKVWEDANGRMLDPLEHVHHINGIKTDNRPENLVALSASEHRKAHSWAPIRKPEEHRRKLSEAGKRVWAERRKAR